MLLSGEACIATQPLDLWVPKCEMCPHVYSATSPQLKSNKRLCPSVFVNSVLLEHTCAHLFTYCVQLLSFYKGRVEQLQQRRYGLQRLKYLLSGALQKRVQTPTVENQSFSALRFDHPRRQKHIQDLAPKVDHGCQSSTHTNCFKWAWYIDKIEETLGLLNHTAKPFTIVLGEYGPQTSSPEKTTLDWRREKSIDTKNEFLTPLRWCMLCDYCTIYKWL